MSTSYRTPETLETFTPSSPDADTQPVEPPPTPPGGDAYPVMPPRVHPSVGSFGELTAGVARGWALDPDLPNGPIAVYFYVDGPMANATFAGRTWADLSGTAGTQGANHGFAWRIPDTYRNGVPHTLYAYAIDCSGLRCDSPLIGTMSFVLQPGNETPVGALETVDGNGTVRGWAVDPNTGYESLMVSFYVSYSFIDDDPKERVFAGQVLADLPRLDVTEATGCQGRHGFEWTIPPEFRSASKLYAYVKDTSTQTRVQLRGSPKLLSTGAEL